MNAVLRSLLSRGLAVVRDRSGRLVNIPPETGIGLGNMLSYWFWAFRERGEGIDAAVVRTEAMARWVETFPRLDELMIDRRRVRFVDGRLHHHMDQTFPTSDRERLEAFIRDYLLSAPAWQVAPDADQGTLTLNVRRGDYYSVPKFRRLYGFDIVSYARTAVEGAGRQLPIDRIRVVSDDPQWCTEHLADLNRIAPVSMQAPSDGPVENLLQLTRARRLVLANSSFSYWAAYISNTWHGDNHALTWAPAIHRRDINGGLAWQLDPRWTIVRELPGGWGEKERPDVTETA